MGLYFRKLLHAFEDGSSNIRNNWAVGKIVQYISECRKRSPEKVNIGKFLSGPFCNLLNNIGKHLLNNVNTVFLLAYLRQFLTLCK